jgi:hypothetical protein
MTELTAEELTETGAAMADVHAWAGSAWRRLGIPVPPVTRASVLADVDELAKRLDGVRGMLAGTEDPSPAGPSTGTGWV